MRPLGLEYLSVFGQHPVDFIHLAADLGCQFVSLNLRGAANRLPGFPDVSLRDDPALRKEIGKALEDRQIGLALVEGFAILPGADVEAYAGDLDEVAAIGAGSVCAVSLEKDLGRTHAQFSALARMADERGMTTVTEVGAGVLRNLRRSREAVEQVGHPSFRLLIDTMHFFRSGSGIRELAELAPGAVGHVQLCDVPMPARIEDYMEEALFERRAPGDGDLPLQEFLKQVPEAVPIGLEVPIRSEADAGIEPHQRLGRCVDLTRALMAAG